jgi:hypothetical protein
MTRKRSNYAAPTPWPVFESDSAVVQFTDKKFIAWDGEGYSDDAGDHHYYLFGNSLGKYVSGNSLSANACFDLLIASPKQNHINVIFAGGYDMVMMIHKWPQNVVERILKGKPTWYSGYRVEYFKGKYLKLSNGKRSCVLYDVFTFFGTSFVNACREYLGDSEDLQRIAEVKLQRDNFTLDSLETLVIPYWQQELKYLVQLCNILRRRLHDADIYPRQWHGPGAVASTILRAKGIGAHKGETGEAIQEASRHAYFGGRFEQHKVGFYGGTVHQYDIRSAYPHAITRLPSLAAMKWRHYTAPKKVNEYGVYRISYKGDPSKPSPFPWRHPSRRIFYPSVITDSWYWGIEILSAMNNAQGTVTVHEGYVPTGTYQDLPFQWIRTMYDDRARMKREGNPTQLALKLGMNSIYGKLAQSKGARFRNGQWELPRYHQLEWAGWITAATRAKIYEAMMRAGNSLIAVETDAVYTTSPIAGMNIGEDLGQWEHEQSDAILYVQSGVYFKNKGGNWKLKSRGFEPRNHTFDQWINVMHQLPSNPDAAVTQRLRRFGTVPSHVTFAKWYETERTANILTMDSKRVHIADVCSACHREESLAESLHDLYVPEWLLELDTPSHPHSLPWVDNEPFEDDEIIITEDGFMSLEFESI